MEGCPHRDLSWFNEIFINPSKPGTVETKLQKEWLFLQNVFLLEGGKKQKILIGAKKYNIG